ncbi:2'-5' RNA ligase superfamily (plasmid) [[Clostridium] sordellii]|uniref:2'-5' RNA ligase family protein n=1 Tax=Paraclostridium sordellii TaxID=1505 RepID=UPI000540E2A2|nr:2'-5' RNA ligase family protein [Paeniclostridium sordellii]CEK32658.1 2'-5' RNA ligase superfamily (plasmid) [[Clostridium] sordellii] [Paeniclostridium sordellii]
MKNRCIMIFPKFNNIEIINKIRKQYDPLFEKVQPHITLIFHLKVVYHHRNYKNI